MSRFASGEKVIRAPWWEESETVTIKKLTFGDRQRIQAQMIDMKMGGMADGKPEAAFDLASPRLALMLYGITAWTFKDESGALVPVTRETIEALESEDGDFIIDAVSAFNTKSKRP